jgi:hypothetical protein
MPELRTLKRSVIAGPRLPEGLQFVKFGYTSRLDRPIYLCFGLRAHYALHMTEGFLSDQLLVVDVRERPEGSLVATANRE